MRSPSPLERFLTVFPPPRFLSMPAVGLDISDYSIKFIEIVPTLHGMAVGAFGSRDLPVGIIEKGAIVKRDALVAVLRELREAYRFRFVRASLPEEKGYLYVTEIPPVSKKEARGILQFKLEENVPLKPEEALFDVDIVPTSDDGDAAHTGAVVSVFPAPMIEGYTGLFYASGFTPLSLEIEAQAIARCVVPRRDRGTCMVVDFGATRTGISVVLSGVVHYTTTVEIGGEALSAAIREQYPDTAAGDINRIKNEQGILGGRNNQPLFSAMMNVVSALRDEINRHIIYWHTHTEFSGGHAPLANATKSPLIERVLLCGGSANLAGLPEHLATTLKLPVERANVWCNVLSTERALPPIDYASSLGFAPAIGLALHSQEEDL